MKEDLPLEEVNGHVVDVVGAGVDTVGKSNDNSFVWLDRAKYHSSKKE